MKCIADCRYGVGTYFACGPKFSLEFGETENETENEHGRGGHSHEFNLIIANVLVGDFCEGSMGMTRPPLRGQTADSAGDSDSDSDCFGSFFAPSPLHLTPFLARGASASHSPLSTLRTDSTDSSRNWNGNSNNSNNNKSKSNRKKSPTHQSAQAPPPPWSALSGRGGTATASVDGATRASGASAMESECKTLFERRYDSLVDDVDNPTMFVVFQDAQTLPEFVVHIRYYPFM